MLLGYFFFNFIKSNINLRAHFSRKAIAVYSLMQQGLVSAVVSKNSLIFAIRKVTARLHNGETPLYFPNYHHRYAMSRNVSQIYDTHTHTHTYACYWQHRCSDERRVVLEDPAKTASYM